LKSTYAAMSEEKEKPSQEETKDEKEPENFDVIVLGTGLKECILSGLMSSVEKQKVLHMDRNKYYGGESASLNLEQLYQKFRGEKEVPPKELGRPRDYNVDLCPKFLMACGNLVKILLRTKVTRYLEFKSVGGSYVFKDKQIYKVPSTPSEALNSDLMGIFQKRYFKSFINFVLNWNPDDAKTHEGLNLDKTKTKDVFEKYSLDENTAAFTGHALALQLDDKYLEQPARDTIERAKLYTYSMARYGNSPYIYPNYGLGGLPEGFSRLSAIYGGTYMLNSPITEITYDKEGKVTGVKYTREGQPHVAYCKKLIADPSYILESDASKVKKTGQVARCICILSAPVPNTNNADSAQIIIPGKHLKRRSDVYVSVVSYHMNVASKGKYIAVASCLVESTPLKDAKPGDENKNALAELKPALDLLGKIDQQFFWVSDQYVPVSDGSKDNVFITSSYDATSHFETATTEVLDLYKRITGKDLDLAISAEPDDLDPSKATE
jgi:Rab GDP dissociation inhibitor